MGIKAGVGMSFNRNPKTAGREAVDKALKNADIEKPDFVFMFATVGYDQEVLLKTVRDATGHAPLCGCSGEGIITSDNADESTFCVAVMTILSDQLNFTNGIATGLSENSAKVGREIASSIQPELLQDNIALFVFPDGMTINFDRMLEGLEGQLKTDGFLPILGGTSGDNLKFERTYQYCNDRVLSNGVSWVLLSGDVNIAWAVDHACVSTGIEHKVTRSKSNVIYEIDDRPALEVIKDYLSSQELEDWNMAVLAFHLGIKVPGSLKGYDEYIIRALVGGKDETTGSITIPTEIPEGTDICVSRRDPAKLIEGVDRIGEKIKNQIEDNPAKLVFQFDCAGRGKQLLRDRQKVELMEKLSQKIGHDVPWLGFYSYGEICPLGQQNYFHNFTLTLGAIY